MQIEEIKTEARQIAKNKPWLANALAKVLLSFEDGLINATDALNDIRSIDRNDNNALLSFNAGVRAFFDGEPIKNSNGNTDWEQGWHDALSDKIK